MAPLIEAGNVYLPEEAGWKDDFLLEMALVPKGKHDDQADAMAQALLRFEKSRKKVIRYFQHTVI